MRLPQLLRKKEMPYKEGILKGIGSLVGMHPYKGRVGINFRGH